MHLFLTGMLTGHQIRRTFLDFFAQQGHRLVRSSSLVPVGDPTLLFTNAGMNQFKDVFLGLEQRDYKRATSAQKCVRAGGKHNDLENVGFTNRHHTFFEMLGNFSFGDYFKKDAVAFAWELITSSAAGRFGIPVEKLYFTVFGGAEIAPGEMLGVDEEACGHLGRASARRSERVIAVPGLKENFWAMGDTGPCGPCSETPLRHGSGGFERGPRRLPVWLRVRALRRNLESGFHAVQSRRRGKRDAAAEALHRHRRGARTHGRGAARKNQQLRDGPLSAADGFCQQAFAARRTAPRRETDASLRILADHSRAAAFLIGDGVMPSNEGRGYVLRKIIRRAVRHGRMLGLERPFLFEMAQQVARRDARAVSRTARTHRARVTGIIRHEEERFAHTIDIGLRKLEEELAPLLADKNQQGRGQLSRRKGFRLYDTFGLPLDFITDVLRDQGIAFDRGGVRPRHGGAARRAPGLPGRARTRKSPARPTPSWRRLSAPSPISTTAPARATAASRPSSPPAGR